MLWHHPVNNPHFIGILWLPSKKSCGQVHPCQCYRINSSIKMYGGSCSVRWVERSLNWRHMVVVINSNTVLTALLECAHYSASNHIQTLVFVWSKETGKDKYLRYKNLEQQCLKQQQRTVCVCVLSMTLPAAKHPPPWTDRYTGGFHTGRELLPYAPLQTCCVKDEVILVRV